MDSDIVRRPITVKSNVWTLCALFAGILLTLPGYARADDRSDAVDKLFDRWNTSFSAKTLEPSLPLAAYAVLYYSADLDTVYTVLIHGQTLSLRTPRGDVLLTLNPGDTYDLRSNISEVKVSGMLVFS